MTVEALGGDHPLDEAMRVEDELAFGEVELERLAPGAAFRKHRKSHPQGFEHWGEKGARLVVWLAVDGRLRLLIRKLGCRAHHGSLEPVRALSSRAVECHRAGK